MLTRNAEFSENMIDLFSSLTQSIIKPRWIWLLRRWLPVPSCKPLWAWWGLGRVLQVVFWSARSCFWQYGERPFRMQGVTSSLTKGGVYDSPSLSAYSNQIHDTRKFFALSQKGPAFWRRGWDLEAIMPLTRAGDGLLGTRCRWWSERRRVGRAKGLYHD